MRYIFLDIDGVLVKEDKPEIAVHTLNELNQNLMQFDPECLVEFETVVRKYVEYKIIISSSWREFFTFEDIKNLFSQDIIPKIAGMTPIYSNPVKHFRYKEILDYLKAQNAMESPWIAIDDIAEFFPPDAPVIITNPFVGFDKKAAQQLDDFLKRKPPYVGY